MFLWKWAFWKWLIIHRLSLFVDHKWPKYYQHKIKSFSRPSEEIMNFIVCLISAMRRTRVILYTKGISMGRLIRALNWEVWVKSRQLVWSLDCFRHCAETGPQHLGVKIGGRKLSGQPDKRRVKGVTFGRSLLSLKKERAAVVLVPSWQRTWQHSLRMQCPRCRLLTCTRIMGLIVNYCPKSFGCAVEGPGIGLQGT